MKVSLKFIDWLRSCGDQCTPSLRYTPLPRISGRGGVGWGGGGGYNHPELSTDDALDIHLDWELEDGIWTVGLVDVAEVVAGI